MSVTGSLKREKVACDFYVPGSDLGNGLAEEETREGG